MTNLEMESLSIDVQDLAAEYEAEAHHNRELSLAAYFGCAGWVAIAAATAIGVSEYTDSQTAGWMASLFPLAAASSFLKFGLEEARAANYYQKKADNPTSLGLD